MKNLKDKNLISMVKAGQLVAFTENLKGRDIGFLRGPYISIFINPFFFPFLNLFNYSRGQSTNYMPEAVFARLPVFLKQNIEKRCGVLSFNMLILSQPVYFQRETSPSPILPVFRIFMFSFSIR